MEVQRNYHSNQCICILKSSLSLGKKGNISHRYGLSSCKVESKGCFSSNRSKQLDRIVEKQQNFCSSSLQVFKFFRSFHEVIRKNFLVFEFRRLGVAGSGICLSSIQVSGSRVKVYICQNDAKTALIFLLSSIRSLKGSITFVSSSISSGMFGKFVKFSVWICVINSFNFSYFSCIEICAKLVRCRIYCVIS